MTYTVAFATHALTMESSLRNSACPPHKFPEISGSSTLRTAIPDHLTHNFLLSGHIIYYIVYIFIMPASSEWSNVTMRSKTRSKRMETAMNEPLPSTCASYTKRMKAPAKSVAERSQNVNYTAAQRLQVLTLYEAGIADKMACALTGVKDVRCIKRWLKKAQEAGYDREKSSFLKLKHVQDSARSGRPVRCGSAQQEVIVADGITSLAFSDFR